MTRHVSGKVGTILAATAAAALVASMMASPVQAQGRADQARPTIVVGASAEIQVTPDRAELSIAVESRARTAAQASTENARIQTAVLEAVRRQGITGPNIQTRSVQVTPEYQYPREGGRPTVTGYVARNEVAVTITDLSKLGPVIDAALAQGATNVVGPRFTISNPDSARREALDAAVRKAMADAQVMARAAGVQLGNVLEMSSHSAANTEVARPVMYRMAAAADAAPTPVETGTITVQASVEIKLAIAP